MKVKGSILDLGFNRYFIGRPPSALGLYIIAFMMLGINLLFGEIKLGLIMFGIIWLIAWLISVPITDYFKNKEN